MRPERRPLTLSETTRKSQGDGHFGGGSGTDGMKDLLRVEGLTVEFGGTKGCVPSTTSGFDYPARRHAGPGRHGRARASRCAARRSWACCRAPRPSLRAPSCSTIRARRMLRRHRPPRPRRTGDADHPRRLDLHHLPGADDFPIANTVGDQIGGCGGGPAAATSAPCTGWRPDRRCALEPDPATS